MEMYRSRAVKVGACALSVITALVVGMELEASLFGDIIPVRENQKCVAFDIAAGHALGTFAMSGDRCYISEWRVRHPFSIRQNGQ